MLVDVSKAESSLTLLVLAVGLLLISVNPKGLAAHCLVGLVVKESASRAEDPGFESRLRRGIFRVESYQ